MASHTLLDTAGAVEQLRTGHVIAYPTEAVYGLGCDPANESAVRKLLSLKGRQASAGLVLIASEYSQLQPWIADIDESLVNKAMQTWPGPVTWLFPRASQRAGLCGRQTRHNRNSYYRTRAKPGIMCGV